jgi:hypothetical protein
MPKKRMRAAVAVTMRLPEGVIAKLRADAHEVGRPAARLARGLIEDVYTLYGLPHVMVEALEADRRSRGLDHREYLVELLSARYRELVLQRPDDQHV